MTLLKKEWKLVMMPVPLLFLLLSALVLVPNYPYYVTFFYTTLGIFLMLQSARENRDLYYMALLPVTKREMVKARFLLVLSVEGLQMLVCIPFLLLRASYGELKNAVGIEANIAFLGLSLVLLGLFNRIFFPMHYKNAYDLGKPFVVSSAVLAVFIFVLEALRAALFQHRLRQLRAGRSAAAAAHSAWRRSRIRPVDDQKLPPERFAV